MLALFVWTFRDVAGLCVLGCVIAVLLGILIYSLIAQLCRGVKNFLSGVFHEEL